MKFLIFTAIVLWSSFGLANSDCDDLLSFWQNDLKHDFMFEDSFDYQLVDNFSCDSPQAQMVEGFLTLRELSTSLYEDQMQKTSEYYYSISTKIDAFAKTYFQGKGISFGTQRAHRLTPLLYAAVIVHESDHATGYDHRTCQQGQFNGEDHCDDTLSFEANTTPYSSELLTIQQARKSGLNDIAESAARLRMEAIVDNMFNSIPSQSPEGSSVRDYFDL